MQDGRAQAPGAGGRDRDCAGSDRGAAPAFIAWPKNGAAMSTPKSGANFGTTTQNNQKSIDYCVRRLAASITSLLTKTASSDERAADGGRGAAWWSGGGGGGGARVVGAGARPSNKRRLH